MIPKTCDQCEAMVINGTFCHEIGCRNSGKRWIDSEWIKFRKCFVCGFDVQDGERCDCQDDLDAECEVEE